MDPEVIEALISEGEGQRVEHKKTLAEGRAAIESMCAFANASGGTVVFGIDPSGTAQGVSLGVNTLEQFATEVREHTDPVLYPRIEVVTHRNKTLIIIEVDALDEGRVAYAYSRAYVRVGRSNQPMSSEEQRRRHQVLVVADKDRPEFDVQQTSCDSLEARFSPTFRVVQAKGDPIGDLKWRCRGPRLRGDGAEWRHAQGFALDRTKFTGLFNLAVIDPLGDDRVGLDQFGLELRFNWKGRWHHELHVWPMVRRELPQKVLWDLKDKILPVSKWVGDD